MFFTTNVKKYKQKLLFKRITRALHTHSACDQKWDIKYEFVSFLE